MSDREGTRQRDMERVCSESSFPGLEPTELSSYIHVALTGAMGSNRLGLSLGPATRSLRPFPLKKKNVPSSVGPTQSTSGQCQAGPKARLAVRIPGRNEGRTG